MSTSLLFEIQEKFKSPENLSKRWLLKKLKKLPPEEFPLLMEVMTQETCLPVLSAISKDFGFPQDFRITALGIRKQLGDNISLEEEGLLEEEQAIRQTLFYCLAIDISEDSPCSTDIINRLARLPEPLTKAILEDVVKERGEAVLPFLKMFYQNTSGNYALMALEVVADIVVPASKKILQEIAGGSRDKAAQKLAKRLLYRLREVALPSEIVEQGIESPPKSILTHPDYDIIKKAWTSFIDGQGNRIIHLLKTLPMAQMQLITLLLSDTDGIIDCQTIDGSKKAISPLMEKILQTKEIIEIPPSYAIALMAEYQDINKKTGRGLPKDFLATLGHILTKKAYSRLEPLIYLEIAAESLRENIYFLNRSEALLNMKEFSTWLIPQSQLERYLLKLREIENSLIIVSEYLQRERIEEVYREVIREFFSNEKRGIYKRRLEEMAYFLWATERQEEARCALAAALSLEDLENDKILEHPFAIQLIYRSIDAVRH